MRTARHSAGLLGILLAGALCGAPPGVGITGEPFDSYDGRVLITQAGALGTAKFQISLDGATTFYLDGREVTAYLPWLGIYPSPPRRAEEYGGTHQ